MSFRDLDDVAGVEGPKILPIRGVAVEFPATVSAKTGTLILAALAAGINAAENGEENAVGQAMAERGLSESDMQLIEDDLIGPAAAVQLEELQIWGKRKDHIVSTLMIWHIFDTETAEQFWDSGGKAPARLDSSRATQTGSGPSLPMVTVAPDRSLEQPSTVPPGGVWSSRPVVAELPGSDGDGSSATSA